MEKESVGYSGCVSHIAMSYVCLILADVVENQALHGPGVESTPRARAASLAGSASGPSGPHTPRTPTTPCTPVGTIKSVAGG